MPRLLTAVLTAVTLALAACGSSNGTSSSPSSSAPASAAPSVATSEAQATTSGSSAGCTSVKAQKPVKPSAKKPTTTLPKDKTSVVTLMTSCGEIQITLDVKEDPKTASSFASLVSSGFYDGLGVVRVVPGFVLQAGDPHGDGSGGPGYSVVEPPAKNASYRRGVVAMAKTGAEAPGTSGSQFFIVTGPDAGLPPEYAIAGRVTKGQDVADAIGAIPPQGGQDGPPTMPVVIEKATLTTK